MIGAQLPRPAQACPPAGCDRLRTWWLALIAAVENFLALFKHVIFGLVAGDLGRH
jgi:hypothetical protein